MEQKQQIASTARVARGAVLVGEVTLGEESSVWYNAVVRADNAPIVIGARSNIQDCCVLHVDEGHPIQIGDGVTVGHGAILHGCTIGDNSLIGMGAVVAQWGADREKLHHWRVRPGDAGDASAGWFYAVGRTGQGAPPAHRGRD